MDPFSELAAVSRARGWGPVPTFSPLSGTGPSKPLGEGGIAYPSGAGVPACARGAAAADVGERVFSRVRDANMNEESYTYVAVPQAQDSRPGAAVGTLNKEGHVLDSSISDGVAVNTAGHDPDDFNISGEEQAKPSSTLAKNASYQGVSVTSSKDDSHQGASVTSSKNGPDQTAFVTDQMAGVPHADPSHQAASKVDNLAAAYRSTSENGGIDSSSISLCAAMDLGPVNTDTSTPTKGTPAAAGVPRVGSTPPRPRSFTDIARTAAATPAPPPRLIARRPVDRAAAALAAADADAVAAVAAAAVASAAAADPAAVETSLSALRAKLAKSKNSAKDAAKVLTPAHEQNPTPYAPPASRPPPIFRHDPFTLLSTLLAPSQGTALDSDASLATQTKKGELFHSISSGARSTPPQDTKPFDRSINIPVNTGAEAPKATSGDGGPGIYAGHCRPSPALNPNQAPPAGSAADLSAPNKTDPKDDTTGASGGSTNKPGSKGRKKAADQKKKTEEPASSPTAPNPTESASPTQEGFQDPNCAGEMWEPMPGALGWEPEWEYGYETPPSSKYHSNGNVSNTSSPLTGSPRPETPRANPAPAKPEQTSEAKAQPASDKGLEGKEGRKAKRPLQIAEKERHKAWQVH